MDTSNVWEQPIDQSGWDVAETSSFDERTSEHQFRVDWVDRLISFWMDGVQAAERGEEVTKMAQFYDELETRQWGWGSSSNPKQVDEDWGTPWDVTPLDFYYLDRYGEWLPHQRRDQGNAWNGGQEKVNGQVSEDTVRGVHDGDTGRGWGAVKEGGTDKENKGVQELVSRYADRKNVKPERRRKMYDFLQMSTEDKVQKIQEMIYHLHSSFDAR